ncbi:DNA polymerase delta subunit 2 [Phytophthora boehmeriae]|uniref:DNA polymerase delta subunit 2 n=1 Tax=Phytophthora boehmeriae TaxID=109152 RepID=A0A8T1X0L8_9STRA|nr:DNA polymerase delta subunit 2 [Phytophthora boehmeriae]
MATPNICHYGALARVYVEHDEWTEDEKFSKGCFKTNKKAPYKADKDLLLALGDTHLFVLRRKQLQTRSCVCMSPQELTIDSSTQQRLASNFQCPHVTSYDDYEQWAAIEYALIVQVQLTFRTLTSESPRSNNGVAARTKDCLVVVKDGSKLWIEFEHNSGRGAFLDALMAASAPHVMLDLNYADLASPNQVELDTNQEESSHSAALKSPEAQGAGRMVFEFQRAASRLAVILALEMDADDLDIALYGETEHDAVATKGLSSVYTSSDQPQLSFEFRRATLRKAVESRILLSLQLSSELELDDPHCHFLLGTAMELSGALDEPDLHALTWLASGFINLERALMATPMTSTTLAQSQLEHAIKLARDHSLRFQLALALACCGDLNRLCTKQYATARTLLVEAARLMPAHTLDTVGKMQLHSKIHRLSLAVSPRNENATHDKNVIDLWKTLSTALSSTTTSSQYPLLRPVIKSRTDRSRFCFVEVHDATEDATTSKRPHRLRVYFTEQTTFQWLRDEIAERCNTVPMFDPSEETEHTTAQVVGFYDSISKSSSMIPWTARIAEITRLDWHVLHALVHQTVCTDVETPEDATNDSPRVAKPMAVMIARHAVDYTPTYQRFVLKQKTYAQQFSHIYVSRLQQLRDVVTVQVDAQKEGHVPVLSKIIDLKADGQECVLIGTLLKILKDKPDIFKALTSESGVTPIEKIEKHLATTEDELLLEDESGRVELVGDIDIPRMVSGVVLGVRGRVPRDGAGGQFHVDEIFLPSFPPQHSLPERAESEYMALVSGLAVGRNSDAQPLRNHVLVDYLAGRLGDDKEKEFVARIVRTVVVGNVLAATDKADTQVPTLKRKTAEELTLDAEPLKNADELVSTLAAAMCVDLMPGPSDPSNYTLPQQSFHPCLFPRSSHFKSFRCVTNPYEAQVGGVQLFGHSGQPLQSMLQCTLPKGGSLDDEDGDANMATEQDKDKQKQERALDYLEQSLKWRHAAPTAPDMLACFPMANEDPFVIENCPHVYFAGNQPHFSTRLVKGAKGQEVRLVTVPSFSETSTIVLVDLKDLSCFPITIGA